MMVRQDACSEPVADAAWSERLERRGAFAPMRAAAVAVAAWTKTAVAAARTKTAVAAAAAERRCFLKSGMKEDERRALSRTG